MKWILFLFIQHWLKAEREKVEVLYDDFNIANV